MFQGAFVNSKEGKKRKTKKEEIKRQAIFKEKKFFCNFLLRELSEYTFSKEDTQMAKGT